ncbi:hypothetical protein K7432_015246 [Basidiobolus ranarum]|uniref:Dienelactone hydrolase domain-containing protein n=1 Tax=Basidiobolus ranarum TaxID=34480 RepID=A0ABR2VP66_9FUNG
MPPCAHPQCCYALTYAYTTISFSSLAFAFAAASLIHPSFLADEDAEHAQAPILLIPTKDEPDFTEFMNILSKKPFGDKCQQHRFDDMFHGFAAARGDYTNAQNVKRATEAIQLTGDFFNSHVHPN